MEFDFDTIYSSDVDLSHLRDQKGIYFITYTETYGGTGKLTYGMPHSTSITLCLDLDENSEYVGKKYICHKYYGVPPMKNRYEFPAVYLNETVEDVNEIFDELSKIGIENLKHDYTVNKGPLRSIGRWTLRYNNGSTVVGSKFIKIDTIEKVKELLGFQKAEKQARDKVHEIFESQDNIFGYGTTYRFFEDGLSTTKEVENKSLQQSGKVKQKTNTL